VRTAIWPDPQLVRARLDAELARIVAVLDARGDIEQVWRFGSSPARRHRYGRLHRGAVARGDDERS
jgi:hypothetical protein